MKLKNNISHLFKASSVFLISILLYGCGSDSDGEAEIALCDKEVTGVNWEALLTENCESLSDYNLFADSTDPTSKPNERGIPYDLSTPLFTDYASKYRFVFVPEGETATYSDNEVMEFPIGSVLVKTFSLPENTANRGINETHIETRLLVHRENGWIALPYSWETQNEASYVISGKTIENVSLVHNGETKTFNYDIPLANQCTTCHSIVPILQDGDDKRLSIFKPIGPKARFLNTDYEYSEHTMNQLSHWENQGILTNVPTDNTSINTAPIFTDSTDINALTDNELDLTARAYLDINCAHCHRSELTLPEEFYSGAAGDSGLTVEFNRNFDDSPSKFGVCKTAVAGGSDTDDDGNVIYPRDLIPGYADKSYLLFRMNTTEARHKMPENGRNTIHTEGVQLIEAWINSMPMNNCGLAL